MSFENPGNVSKKISVLFKIVYNGGMQLLLNGNLSLNSVWLGVDPTINTHIQTLTTILIVNTMGGGGEGEGGKNLFLKTGYTFDN